MLSALTQLQNQTILKKWIGDIQNQLNVLIYFI